MAYNCVLYYCPWQGSRGNPISTWHLNVCFVLCVCLHVNWQLWERLLCYGNFQTQFKLTLWLFWLLFNLKMRWFWKKGWTSLNVYHQVWKSSSGMTCFTKLSGRPDSQSKGVFLFIVVDLMWVDGIYSRYSHFMTEKIYLTVIVPESSNSLHDECCIIAVLLQPHAG